MTAMTGAAMVVLSCTATGKVMDLGMETRATPYERYMDPVKEVLRKTSNLDSEWNRVSRLLEKARGFRYRHNEAYVARSPEVTEQTRTGDCKDKSLWLLAKMGSGNARFAIGKLKASSRINHAWVYWQNEKGDWFILDPTHRSRPLSVEDVSSQEYLPLYSYAANSVFMHDAMRPVVGSRRPLAVAQASKNISKQSVAKGVVVKGSNDEMLAASNKTIKATKASKVAKRTSSKADNKLAKSSEKTLPVAEMDSSTDNKAAQKFAARLNRLSTGRSML